MDRGTVTISHRNGQIPWRKIFRSGEFTVLLAE